MRFTEAVVLITGSSGGIGAACAAAFSERGARVIVHGRDTDRLDAVAAGLGAKAIRADLTDPGGPEALAAAATEVYGQVDAVLHCAGVGWFGDAVTMP
ncbi:MAG: SDR family NAD(P)-dependent oxidoreductase, partial [Actinobacteria bacterium]|nr:SDR family NAD(P)-dependent oxidoreductase [Actinomycetota bacterium]